MTVAEARQPVWLKREEVPPLPEGWRAMPTEEACVHLKPGKLFDTKSVFDHGAVPVLNQSETDFLGYHDEEPGVDATTENPVVTFANHTCAMRLMKRPFSTIQNIFPKVGKPGVTDTVYFYYASLGRVGLSDYKGHHPIFRQAHIPVPPLSVQRRIAGILLAYDELIENNLGRIRILEAMARALYREWFVHFRFPGREKLLSVASPLGNIPKGWEIKKLTEVAEVNRAQISSRNAPDELHYIDISSVSPGQIHNVTTYAFADAPGRARRIVQNGDVLWSCVRPNRRSHAQVMHPELNTIASTGFAVLTATKVPFTFLYFATTTDDFVSYLTNNATGAAYPAVSAGTFEKADLLIASEFLLKKFGEATIPMAEQIHLLQLQIHNLRQTRDLLLPRLLSGMTIPG
jgi:type I restriction enzyme S subunit